MSVRIASPPDVRSDSPEEGETPGGGRGTKSRRRGVARVGSFWMHTPLNVDLV